MSNEEQAPRESGHEPGSDGPIGPDGSAVVHPDEVVLDDADISAGTLEPELSVSPDTLDLAEPALGPARISSDVAEAASLEEAAAEARAVAAEAEKAGILAGGPMPAEAPITEAAPDGTAPAGGPAGDAQHDDGDAAAEASTATASDDGNSAGPVIRDAAASTDVAPQHGDEPVSPDPQAPTHPSGAATDGSVSAGEPVPASGSHPARASGDGAGDGAAADERDETDVPSSAGNHTDSVTNPPSAADGPVGGPYAFPPEGGEPGLGHASRYLGTDPAGVGPAGAGSPAEPSVDSGGDAAVARAAGVPTAHGTDAADGAHPTRDRTRARSSTVPLLLVIGGVVVLLGLLVWLLVSLFGGQGDEGRVDPSSLNARECLADFTVIAEEARLVDCTEPHDAQLVAIEIYSDASKFPGRSLLET